MKFLSLFMVTLLFSSLSQANISFNNIFRQWSEKDEIVQQLAANDWVLVGKFILTKSEAHDEFEVYSARLPEEKASDTEFINSLGISKDLLIFDLPKHEVGQEDGIYFIPREIQFLDKDVLVINYGEEELSYYLHFPFSSEKVILHLNTFPSVQNRAGLYGELSFIDGELHLISKNADSSKEIRWVFSKEPVNLDN